MDIAATSRPMPRERRAPSVPIHGPELVIGIVRPAGTPDGEFHEVLSGQLLAYGYETKPVKLSQILADLAADRGAPIPLTPEDLRIALLMDEGDLVCRRSQQAAAVALLGVGEIRQIRADRHASTGSQADASDEPIPRIVYVMDSIKRPAEVTQLQRIYGDHLILVGLQATPEARSQNLLEKIEPQHLGMSGAARKELVTALIDRDYDEGDDDYGQKTLKTFPMADVFIDVAGDMGEQVGRLIDLLFGSPEYRPPTPAEFGMHLAYISSTRSAELGLKVGAALIDEDGSIAGLGMNTHPNSSVSPAFDASANDIRELTLDTLDRLRGLLSDAAVEQLDADPGGFVRELLLGPLGGGQIDDLTEFQRPVHAEMDALLSAIGRGSRLDGATAYVTAFPCHNCAKHLVALGLKVQYLEPYPKSRAAAMYGPEVSADFLPFSGIAPRRYQQLFGVSGSRKEPDGTRKAWGPDEKRTAQPRVNRLVDHRGISDRETAALAEIEIEAEAEAETETETETETEGEVEGEAQVSEDGG